MTQRNRQLWTTGKSPESSTFLFYYFRHYSSSLLVVMSLERFFALYFPLKSKTVCTMKTAKWSTGSLALIFLVYNVQYLVIYKSKVTDGVYSCLFPNKKLLAVLDRIDSILYSFGTFTVMILLILPLLQCLWKLSVKIYWAILWNLQHRL